MSYIKRISLSTLVVLLLTSCKESQSYDVKFGILKIVDEVATSIAKETTEIDYITRDAGQYFGVVIIPTSSNEYTTTTVTYLPGVPLELTGSSKGEDPEKAPLGLKSPTYPAKGVTVHTMGLDPGDPIGTYKTEVFINGNLEKEISFEVAKNK